MNIPIPHTGFSLLPDCGPGVKTYKLPGFLPERHTVMLVSFVRGDQSDHIRCLERCCRAVHTAFAGFSVRRCRSCRISDATRSLT